LVASIVGWLLDDHLLLSDFGPNEIIFMNVFVVTVAMVMLLRDFGLYVFYMYVGRGEKIVKGFGGKARRKETTEKTKA
jgi:hypothetical protein